MTEVRPAPRGEELADAAELLLRQVHPAFVQAGRVSSQAFRPGRSDAELLSVSRGAMTTPEGAWRLHTEGKRLASVGVWGVPVEECNALTLRCYCDPEPGPPPDPAHALVDFRGLTRGECESRSKRLTYGATQRGCLFSAPGPG